MAWEATTFLLGEYGEGDIQSNPLFSIIDGLIMVTQRLEGGEQQRFLRVVKMRGTDHSRDAHPFVINDTGVEVFAPRVTIQREDRGPAGKRCKTGISKLDELLGEGIPRGSSLLVAGVAGTGKTMLSLEFVYRGAKLGEKGIVFSFEETEERLLASAAGLGWDLARQIKLGMIEIVFIPQPEIMVEEHLVMIGERIAALGAKRVVVDSLSVFLHKVQDPRVAREKTFQIASLVQNAQAVGFLATDVPYGADQVSRFGVEETVVDGVVLLSATTEGFERNRYVEIYKLRNTAHLSGRHDMLIGEGGVAVFPRFAEGTHEHAPARGRKAPRLATGVPGLDPLLGGGVFDGSTTFVAGSAGAGKTSLGIQFIVAGARKGEPGLFVSLEETPSQIRAIAEGLRLPLDTAVAKELVAIVHLARERVRPNQVLAMLADMVDRLKTKRVVIDGASHLLRESASAAEHRDFLAALVHRVSRLGVTIVLTFETRALGPSGMVTESAVSPIADNLLMMRYRESDTGLRPTLTVVKTRGSEHDFRTHDLAFGLHGLRVMVESKDVKSKQSAKKRRSR
jgi:circadian clock protein KaiC